MKVVSVILIVLLFAGCATARDRSHEKLLDSFIGRSADDVIASQRLPDREYTLSDGRRILEFRRQREETVYESTPGEISNGPSSYRTTGTIRRVPSAIGSPSYEIETETREQRGLRFITRAPSVRPAGTVVRECVTRLTVDQKGIVRDWSYQGYC